MEEAAKEKKVAKQEARKARRERAKTQQAAAAVAAKEEEEAEVKAATEIAIEHADPTKASKVESAVKVRPGSASDSAPGLLGWRRGHNSSLGALTQWLPPVEWALSYIEALRPLVHLGRVLGLRREHACSIFRSY